jgi:DNA-binding response OmpR family regulator
MSKLLHIIEDDKDILTMLEIFFKRKGFQVIADYNGNDLDLKSDPCPDVYLIDINLIGKNGIDICKMIRKECGHVPIVMMSANMQLQQLARECDADAFVAKPFDMNTILNAVTSAAA